MIKEFRDFINRGSFVEIAVAFVMGAAFGAVVTALTTRVISPLIALIFRVPDLSGIGTFGEVDPATGVPAGSLGAFLSALINFVIIAFVIFLVVRAYNKLNERLKEPAAEAGVSEAEDVVLLRQIRDALTTQPPRP